MCALVEGTGRCFEAGMLAMVARNRRIWGRFIERQRLAAALLQQCRAAFKAGLWNSDIPRCCSEEAAM